MNSLSLENRYVAFLRGINVGDHHKVPMAQLKVEMEQLGFSEVITLLNSGNIIFKGPQEETVHLQDKISVHLEKIFGFPIPTVVKKAVSILQLIQSEPFKDFILSKDIRFYVSFLWKKVSADIKLPWISTDNSYKILSIKDQTIISVLDLSINQTPKAMEALEKMYGKEMTTRNWKTLLRIEKKLHFHKD